MDEAGGVPALAAAGLDPGVELVDQGCHGQARAVEPRLLEADGQVLAHPVDGEAEFELAPAHGRRAVLHLPGLGRALGDGGEHLVHVEAGLQAEVERLGQPLNDPRDAELIDHLGELPGARGADQVRRPGITIDHGLGALEVGRLAAAHDRQHAVLGARLAARDGRVDGADATLRAEAQELAGDNGRSRGVVDEEAAGGETGEDPRLAQDHGAQVVVVADAGEGHLGAFGRGARARRAPPAVPSVFRDPGFGLGFCTVIDRNVVAGGGDVPGHGIAHHAETDEGDLGHAPYPPLVRSVVP